MNRTKFARISCILIIALLIASHAHAQGSSITNGLNWLEVNQNADGSWGAESSLRDTTTVIDSYKILGQLDTSYYNAISWMNVDPIESNDYIARRVISLSGTGVDVSSYLQQFVFYQNSDGGWGYFQGFGSDVVDTVVVLNAFRAAQFHSSNAIGKSINYLVSKQNLDGSWSLQPDAPGDITTTSLITVALKTYGSPDIVNASLDKSISWLKAKQNIDGGFGDSPSTIQGTTLALKALLETGQVEADSLQNALNFVTSSQLSDGSWSENPYETALALQMLASLRPNLSIFPSDISLSNPTPKSGEIVKVSAIVRNTGSADASNIPVEIFAQDPNNQMVQIGATQTITALPVGGSATVEVDFDTKNRAGLYNIIVKIDPDNTISELTKEDNQASVEISITPVPDLVVTNGNISFSKNPANVGDDVTISASVSNQGNFSAQHITVAVYHDSVSLQNLIGSTNIALLDAGQSSMIQIIWKTNEVGTGIPIYVVVDPPNQINELTKDNNQASALIDVAAVIEANLTISYKDISFNPTVVTQDGSVAVSAIVRNEGFATADSVEVAFYKGDPSLGGVLLGMSIIPTLPPGSSSVVSFNWTNIAEYGERLIYIKVDPSNKVVEFNKDDNTAFSTLKILSYPDLVVSSNSMAFTPVAPKVGDIVTISVTVSNTGDQDAANFAVTAYEGSTSIGSQSIPLLSGKSQKTVTFTYDTTGKSGTHTIKVVADPDNTIKELSKDNNQASRSFGVYNANLSLSEKYFSPNGDGVKDTTQFFFRLDSPQTVKIVVVNKKGAVVRTFSGPDLENTSSGSVTWDGLDDNGKLVDDGHYMIQLRAIDDTILQETEVVVDTNNSSLSDALATGSLLFNNLSCMMPSDQSFAPSLPHIWLPDGSGVLYYVETWKYNQIESAGLYIMSPDGRNIQKITSDEWLIGAKRYIKDFALSPDGQNIAVLTYRQLVDGYGDILTSEIWVMSIDGKNLRQLDEKNPNTVDDYYAVALRSVLPTPYEGSRANNDVLKWSADSRTIAYPVVWWNGSYFGGHEGGAALWTVDIQTGVKTTAFTISSRYFDLNGWFVYDGTGIDFIRFAWAPNNTSLAVYVNVTSPCSLWLVSKDGSSNKQVSFASEGYEYEQPQWITDSLLYIDGKLINVDTGNIISYADQFVFLQADQKIAYWSGNDLFIYDIDSDTSQSISTTGVDGGFSASPDNRKIAYWNNRYNVAVYDIGSGTSEIVTDINAGIYSEYPGFIFSPDSKKIALTLSKVNNPDLNEIVIFDLNTRVKTVIGEEVWGPNLEWSLGIEWTPDSNFLIAEVLFKYPDPSNSDWPYTYEDALFLIDVTTGERTFLTDGYLLKNADPYDRRDASLWKIPAYRNCFVYSDPATSDSSTGCIPKSGGESLWVMSSAANLTAELTPVKGDFQVTLNGTATDLNFEGYKIEYSLIDAPDVWYPIIPFSDMPVLRDTFATWIPPNEGIYYVRLTAWDKAGNVAESKKRISWRVPSSGITNLWLSDQIFSPNGDGVKDTVTLYYKVLEPVHLDFYISDLNDNMLRSYSSDHSAPGDYSTTWDGRDESGKVLPDGKYKIKVFEYVFFVEIDTTAPVVYGTIASEGPDGRPGGGIPHIIWGLAYDDNFKEWTVEELDGTVSGGAWETIASGSKELIDWDFFGIRPVKVKEGLSIGKITGKQYRITAEDYAGNQSVSTFKTPEMIDITSGAISEDHAERLDLAETIIQPIDYVVLQWQYPPTFGCVGEWRNDVIIYNQGDTLSENFSIDWDFLRLNLLPIEFRIKAVDVNGTEFVSSCWGIGGDGTIAAAANMPPLQLNHIIPPSPEDPDNYTIKGFHSLEGTNWTLNVQKTPDSNPRNWNTFYSIPLPPPGEFELKVDKRFFNLCNQYAIKFVATSADSTVQSNEGDFDVPCIEFINGYLDANNCNTLSQKVKVATTIELLNLRNSNLKELSIGVSASEKPLQNLPTVSAYTISSPIWGQSYSGVLDVSSLPEGDYSLFEVLKYSEPDMITNVPVDKQIVVYQPLSVDKTLPTAKITYPGAGTEICPISVSGNLQGVPVEGIAIDNKSVKGYEVFYGAGDSTDAFNPAMIKGKAANQGQLGIWNIPDSEDTSYSLKLKVVDTAGNVSCNTVNFFVDRGIEMANLAADKTLFSPVAQGVSNNVNITYEIGKYATVDIKIYQMLTDVSQVAGSIPVRTLVTDLQHLGGSENSSWDGRNDSGASVPDGIYSIVVFATDSCGKSDIKWINVEVDGTPPTTVITYPRPPDSLGTIVEVKGTADAPHFDSYVLDVGQGDNPTAWSSISSGSAPVDDNILGTWNTFGLPAGVWTLRLSATDTAGNKNSATVMVNLIATRTLVSDLNATPRLFSPNGDGILDTTNINYTLTDSCQVKLEILDSSALVRKTYTTTSASSGTYTFVWDGRDVSGATVPDGTYSARLTASLSSDSSVTQTESVTVMVDTAPPLIDINQPVNNSYVSTVVVNGSISDQDLSEYTITYTGASGSGTTVDQGSQSRQNYTFGVLNGLNDGNYTLNVVAKDSAGNTAQKSIAFTVDKAVPGVVITSPVDGQYYGSVKDTVTITGTITDQYLDSFSLRYGQGDSPSQWTELLSGNTLPTTSQLYSWNVGSNSGIPDGLYTLSLLVTDKSGLAGEARVKIIIDNTLPSAAITSPQDGAYVKSGTYITGAASDSNLDKYTLGLSAGQCDTASEWAIFTTSTTAIENSTLGTLPQVSSDGSYCLKLSVTDKVGNMSEAKININMDTQVPSPPVLSGSIDNKINASLNWTQNTASNISGYNVYRSGQKINATQVTGTTYFDQNLQPGTYAYTVTAVDFGGNESVPSNQVQLTVNPSGPDARISSPSDGSMVGGIVDIRGTAFSADNFKQYRVYIGQGANSTSMNLVRTSPVPIQFGVLTEWDTSGLSGAYTVRLEAEDLFGNINAQQITVTIDNIPPAAPVLISAVPNGSNVTLIWNANAETDLAGYLLYRNDQVVNAPDTALVNLKPYLMTSTYYIDRGLPDGTFTYYLIAMDQAGNMSSQSNSITVNIEREAPHATIVQPATGTKFEFNTLIKAQCADLDIAWIQFQYKRAQDTTWTNLGNPITQLPYVIYLNPSTLGMTYGDYNIRAVATDTAGKTDLAPTYITITYADITPPAAPQNLKAQVTGNSVTLTWSANTETDLSGYNVYRVSGTTSTKINTTVINNTTYQDTGLADGTYTYSVTALDTAGNESGLSGSVSANVYAPKIIQQYTPTAQSNVAIQGSNAAPNAAVAIFSEVNSVKTLSGTVNADSQGNFSLPSLTLSLGENRITATATDSAGNVSRSSDLIVVVYDESPSAPTGLQAAVNGNNVALTWNANPETNILGYNLYRDGARLNAAVPMTAADAVSINGSPSYYDQPQMAFDGDPSTFWVPDNTLDPFWWEVDLSSLELISHIEIQWLSGGGNVYGGKDYEIQAWSGYAWIAIAKITGNSESVNSFDFVPSYRTDRIRLYITDTIFDNRTLAISEISMLKDNLITNTSYTDSNLGGGAYGYKATAVDYYGFESLPSDETSVSIAPQPTITVTKSGAGSGTITSTPSGIDCGTICSNYFGNDTTVTLTASLDSCSNLTAWSGCDSVSGANCTVVMNSNKTLNAEFSAGAMVSPLSQFFTQSGGTGAISISAGSACSWTVQSNSPWINITSGTNGLGSGIVTYSVLDSTNIISRIGTITVAGQTFTVNQAGIGGIDTTFGAPDGAVTFDDAANDDNWSYAVTIQPDGKIIVVGEVNYSSSGGALQILRYNADGTLDSTFGSNGVAEYEGPDNGWATGYAVAIQADGKIVAVGEASDGNALILRYNSDGTPDNTFGTNGVVTYKDANSGWTYANAVVVQDDGKIVVACGGSGALRYNSDGTPDNTFGTGGVVTYVPAGYAWASSNTVVMQSDGKIIVAGNAYNGNSNNSMVLRLNNDGTLDNSFGVNGSVTDAVDVYSTSFYTAAIQTDGKIVVAGWSNPGALIMRYDSDGTPDNTFGTNGSVIFHTYDGGDWAASVAVQPDGKIIVGGSTNDDVFVLRYNADGTLDSTFGASGVMTYNDTTDRYDWGYGMVMQPDGKIVVVGERYTDEVDEALLLRINNAIPYSLAVTKLGTGTGTVRSSETPPSINCGTTCLSVYNPGDIVTLTATADVHSVFTGWSGGGCSGTDTCVVTINNAQSIAASFMRVVPSAPQNLTATSSESNVILTWTANTEPDIGGYNIYRGSGQDWVKLNSSLSLSTSYTDANLKNGTYIYRVTAVDSSGGESQPSNEATAQVSAVITPPGNLQVIAVPQGSALNISWQNSGSAVGFNLYRSPTTGGPYVKLNVDLLTNASYADTGLTNGTAYYYVATAEDAEGNESAYSNEAMGIPADIMPPAKPDLFYPTLPGRLVSRLTDKTNISGSAEPASIVKLFQNDTYIGETTSLDNDVSLHYAIDTWVTDASVSSDEETFAYTSNGSIWLKDLTTGVTNMFVQGHNPLWSPDGSKLAYISSDNNGRDHIGLYNAVTGDKSPLTGDSDSSESNPSWSVDGNKIAFISNRGGSYDVWVKDNISGSMTQITNGVYPSYPKLSPDGNKLAYFVRWNLYVMDIASNRVALIDDNTDWWSVSWSPDSQKIAFISYKNGYGDIYVCDANAQNPTQVTSLFTYDLYYPAWSADGRHIIFDKWDYQGDSVGIVSVYEQEQPRFIDENLMLYYLDSLASGGIAYIDGKTLNIVHMKGTFTFKDEMLYPGENIFYVTASKISGAVSQPSDKISVIYDTSLLPDLAITPDDIFVYPPYPIVGQQAAINVTIKNQGRADAKNVEADIYLMDHSGNLNLLHSETIPLIAVGSEDTIGLTWAGSSTPCVNNIIVSVDPNNKITESDKSNNYAMKEIDVVANQNIIMNATLDSDSYQANQPVSIDVNIKNPGAEKTAILSISIEDSSGNVVTALNSVNVDLSYGSAQDFPFTWNTGSTYPGNYIVHSVLKDAFAVLVAENKVPFTITPTININSVVVTDKVSYGFNEDVSVIINTTNNGTNYIIPQLDVRTKVTDSSGNILYTQDQNIANVLPGATAALTSIWDTGLNPPGNYNAVVESYLNGNLILSKSVSFEISTVTTITGTITVTPKVVLFGGIAQVNYTIQSTGNATVSSVPVTVLIVDPDTQSIMATFSDSVAFDSNATASGTFTVPTLGYVLKTYVAALQCTYQGNTKTLATSPFTEKDGTPPVVTIISPIAGSNYISNFDLTVNVVDDASGVAKVEYQIDNGGWTALPIADQISKTYSTTWNPANAGNGSHTISFRATDNAGNVSQSVSVTITVTVSMAPPTGSISINNGASYTDSAAVTLNLNASDSSGNPPAQMCASNTTSCTSWEAYAATKTWTLSPGDGLKTVYVWYQDSLGNTNITPYSASITLDTTPPSLAVSAPLDGIWTADSTVTVTGIVSDTGSGLGSLTVNDVVVTPLLDNTFSTVVSLLEGPNTITVKATDNAGNPSEVTHTVNRDSYVPVITITAPSDGSATNEGTTTLTGSLGVDPYASVTSVKNNGSPVDFSFDPGTMIFTASIPLSQGLNTITVQAGDPVHTVSTASVTVRYDSAKPSVAVIVPDLDIATNKCSLTIQATASDDVTVASVTMSVDGNEPQEMALIDGTHRGTISFSTEKVYNIVVTATDEAGNTAQATRSIIYDMTAPVTTATPAGGLYHASQNVSLSCSDTGGDCSSTLYCLGVNCTPNTQYAGAISITASTDLRFYSIDGAGNTESVKTESYTIDDTRIITATAGSGGSVTPSGNVTVNYNADQSFAISASSGYHITDVSVDNVSQGAISDYTFTGVTDSHAITATFAPNSHILTIALAGNGSGLVTGSGTYDYGTTNNVSATANIGSTFMGWSGDCSGLTSPFSVTMLDRDITCTATFTLNQHTLTVTATGNGSGTVTGGGLVNFGSVDPIAAIASTGSTFTGWSGDCAGSVSPLNVTMLDQDMTCTAIFTLNTYSITVSAGAGGSISPSGSPSGTVTLNYGASQVFTIKADSGYGIANVFVDGNSVGGVTSYTFDSVAANHTISAMFADITPPSLTVTTLSDGSWKSGDNILNVSGTASDNESGLQGVTVNGAAVTLTNGAFSVPVTLALGANPITVVATDNANNTTTDVRTINYKPNAPVITISSPANNSATNVSTVTISGSVDAYSQVTGMTNNGTNVAFVFDPNDLTFSADIVLAVGPNLIQVNATDPAVNAASAGITVTYDNQNPSLSVTNPPADTATDITPMTISGSVTDLTITTVTMSVNGGAPQTLTVAGDRTFSANVAFITEQTYAILFTAVDLAGNSATVARNVIYDLGGPKTTATPPGGTYGTPQDVTLSCDDGTGTGSSGCASTMYCLGDNTCTPDTLYAGGAIHVGQSGPLRFFSTDKAGNVESVKTEVYSIVNKITTLSDSNGSVTCSPNPVEYNSTSTCGITPNTGYSVANVIVDGSPAGAVTTHTFNNVTIPHTISATFAQNTTNITLTPSSATGAIGSSHTVTAALLDTLNNPKPGIDVAFSVLSGPNASAVGTCSVNTNCTTDANGQVSFTYDGVGEIGTDQIKACFNDPLQGGKQVCSALVTQQWNSPVCNALSTNASNFNGTSIAAGNYIWFNSIVKVNGRGSNAATIHFAGSTIQFTANGQNYVLNVPGSEIIFSQAATTATTSFTGGKWVTTVPLNYTGNVFLSGLAFPVPSGGLPGGINPVTWSGYFLTDTSGISVQWQWAAAVYTQFSSDYTAIGAKPIDGNTLNQYNNSDHAGTPENFKTHVTGGARGGGGSNYTGSYSGTLSKTPCLY